jgi:protoheme IX farnesyltransferase
VQERITPAKALVAGLVMSVVGVAILALTCGPAAAGVSLATILIYVLIYTPSKPLTVWNTIIGAVPGALPPLIGWCAAWHPSLGWARAFESLAGPMSLGGWSLFALMFVWQIPHFLAIAWMYRADYAAGGYRMLPVVDASGKLTSSMMLSWACVLVLASIWPALVMSDRLGWGTIGVGVVTGVAFIGVIVRFMRTRADGDARRVFFTSITHLPVLTLTMVIEAVLRAGWHA